MPIPEEAGGTLADGRYRLDEVLGRGGMAVVWSALDQRDGVRRAVKILNPVLARKQVFRERFQREARVMARLRHPHVVAIYDVGIDDEQPFLVMDMLTGGCLADLVESGSGLGEVRALEYTLQVLEALELAHERGIIHRDIKPENVLLDEDGWAKVADFGLARVQEGQQALTRTGAVLGTPAYMAPEIRRNARGASVASDLYAVGVVLFVCATGASCWDLEVSRGDADADDSSLRQLIDRATAPDPADRFGSAREMAEAVRALRRSLVPPGTPEPPRPPPVEPGPVYVPPPRPVVVEPVRQAPAEPAPLSPVVPIAVGSVVVLGGLGLWLWNHGSPSRAPAPAPATGIEWVAVTGAGFELSRTEITVDQYRACVAAGACAAPVRCDWGTAAYGDPDRGEHPVNCVDWHGAQAFAVWAGARLPSEEEWAQAARGRQEHVYAGSDLVEEVAWFAGNSDGAAHPPCGLEPNSLGLCDMSGNLWEWTATASGAGRVLRGGSFGSEAAGVRVDHRNVFAPDVRYDSLGFRVAR